VLGSHRFGGATQITIRRPAPQRVRSSRILKGQERVATGEIKAAIAGYLRTVAGDADGWEIEVMLTEKQIRRIVAARGRFTVRGGATPWVGRQRFEVHFGSTDDAAEIVLAEVRLPESVVVAVRDLPRGVVVGRSDVTLVSDQKSVGRVERFHSIDDVVGMETKQPIAHGQPVATASVQPPVLVRQGDSVTVYALGDGIQIRTYGRARQSGSRGDNVWIESMTDRTRYLAEVVSAGVVKIGDNRPAFSDDVRATRKALNTPGGRQPTTGTSR
jgi:flagella basal body P-ring formation protein FlgA